MLQLDKHSLAGHFYETNSYSHNLFLLTFLVQNTLELLVVISLELIVIYENKMYSKEHLEDTSLDLRFQIVTT